MKKFFTFISIVLMVVLASITVSATEITFWAMTNAPSEQHYAWMEEKAAEFEAETGIKVIFEEIGWGEQMQRFTNAIATGEGAEVFQVGTTQNAFFAGTGGLVEMDLADFGGADQYMEASLKSTMLEDKYYGIPWFAETRVLFYNTEMFEKAAVEPPQTWTELIEVGKKIIEVNGKGSAISIAGTGAWDLQHNMSTIMWSYGGKWLNEDNTKAVFNNDAMYKAMDYWVSLVAEGLADKACAEYNQPQADSAFINGDTAMCIMSPYTIANIENDNPGLNWSIVEPPAGPEGRASFAGGSNLVIRNNTSADKIAAAKAWIKFLLQDDKLVEYTKDLSKMLPATKEAFEDPFYNQGVWKTFKKVLGYATAYPSIPEWGQVENVFKTNASNVLTDYINGDYKENTSEEYIDAAVEEVNGILDN